MRLVSAPLATARITGSASSRHAGQSSWSSATVCYTRRCVRAMHTSWHKYKSIVNQVCQIACPAGWHQHAQYSASLGAHQW